MNAKNKTQRYFITNPKAFYDFALGLFSQKVDSSFDNEKYKYPNKSNEIMDNWINNEKDSKFIQILNLFKENVYNNQSAAMDQANAVVRNKDFVKYYWDSVETFINTNNKKDYIQFNKKNDCKLLDDVKNNIDAYTDYIPDKDLVEYIKSIL